jgi:ligand-binding sensor domain-containing protein
MNFRIPEAIFLSFLLFAAPIRAHNGAAAIAVPVARITIDGDLTDWPMGMRSYPIEITQFGDPSEDPFDLRAAFHVGYDGRKNRLYLAVEVHDQSAVVDTSGYAPWSSLDGCEVYLDARHEDRRSAAVQYATFGRFFSAQVSTPNANWAWRRSEAGYIYEWELRVEGMTDETLPLRPGITLGVDVAVGDRDADGSFTWISWGEGARKMGAVEKLGDLVLVAGEEASGIISGEVVRHDPEEGVPGRRVRLQSMTVDAMWVDTRTDDSGSYRVELPPGRYQLESGEEDGLLENQLVEVRSGDQHKIRVSLTKSTGRIVDAGPGKIVDAGLGLRRGVWHHFGVQDGLIDGTVNALLADREGLLWLGTNGGLVRFDGQTFTHFTVEQGLPNGRVTSLVQDQHGVLWLGMSRGLVRFDGRTFTHFAAEHGIPSSVIQALVEDYTGRIWAGTDEGLIRYDGDGKFTTFTAADGLYNENISSLTVDDSGRIWAGTFSGGASVSDGESFTSFRMADGLADNRVRGLLKDGQGRIWIGSWEGVDIYDGEDFIHLATEDGLVDNHVVSFFEDSSGRIWIGTRLGVSTFDERGIADFQSANDWADGPVQAFAEDRDGGIWLGTRRGLIRYAGDKSALSVEGELLRQKRARSLLEDGEGRIWIGTEGGVSIYDDGNLSSLSIADGLIDESVLSLMEDNAGRIWIGTEGGVSIYEGVNLTSLTVPGDVRNNAVRALLEDARGRIWIGTWGGISIYDGERFTHLTAIDGLVNENVWSLLEDAQGRIWIGTQEGVSIYDREHFSNLTAADGLTHNNVKALLEDNQGRIWMGTWGGVSIYDNGNLTSLTVTDGLTHNMVRKLLEDVRGRVWIGTEGGVSLYDGSIAQSLLGYEILPGSSISALIESRQGDIWIGNAREGIVRYRHHYTPPLVRLADIVADRRLGVNDRVELSTSQSYLSFVFQGSSFKTLPQGMLYRYRLRGLEEMWRTTRSRRVEYQDLPRGEYTFEVTAIDRDLDVSEIPVRVAVEVRWPYGKFALWTSLGLALLLVAWQAGQIIRRNRSLQRAYENLDAAHRELQEMQKKLIETEKLETLLEVSGATAHEINQPLQAIMTEVEMMSMDMAADAPEKMAIENVLEYTKMISDIVTKMQSIHQYRTTSYVGGTRIIDLDASSQQEDLEG